MLVMGLFCGAPVGAPLTPYLIAISVVEQTASIERLEVLPAVFGGTQVGFALEKQFYKANVVSNQEVSMSQKSRNIPKRLGLAFLCGKLSRGFRFEPRPNLRTTLPAGSN